MIEASSLRRYAAYAGIALAAVASIATSQTAPVNQRTGQDSLSASAPEVSHHFTVTYDKLQEVTFDAQLTWIPSANAPAPRVAILLTADGRNGGSQETTLSFPATLSPTITVPCDEGPCEQGYTVIVKALAADLQPDFDGSISVHWKFSARESPDATSEIDVVED